ncbi:hypothetical protein GCM10028808_05520 [Spirosoma migulaei]
MNSDNHFGSPNPALNYLEFTNLLAQYKRAVYEKWLPIQLVEFPREIHLSNLGIPVNEGADPISVE